MWLRLSLEVQNFRTFLATELVRAPLEGVHSVGVIDGLKELIGRLVVEDEMGVRDTQHGQEDGEADADEAHETEDGNAGDAEGFGVGGGEVHGRLHTPPNAEGEVEEE